MLIKQFNLSLITTTLVFFTYFNVCFGQPNDDKKEIDVKILMKEWKSSIDLIFMPFLSIKNETDIEKKSL